MIDFLKNKRLGAPRCFLHAFLLGLCLVRGVQAELLAGLKVEPTKYEKIFSFEFKPDQDKSTIEGFIVLPDGIGPFRTVIVNHSPNGSAKQVAHNYAPGFTGRGYAVIAADLNYGAKVEASDWKEMFRRVSACVAIIEHDERFDAKKIFTFGNGAGGMVCLAYAAQSDKLKAVGMTAGGLIPDGGVKYEKISAPIILVHGAKDETVPMDAALQLKANLERAGKTVEFKSFEKFGHEVITLKSGDVYDTIVAFFNKYAN